MVVPVGSGLAADKLPSAWMNCSPPRRTADKKKMAAMAESDGSVLLPPVRLNWESLYINTNVLEANGVAVPTSYAASWSRPAHRWRRRALRRSPTPCANGRKSRWTARPCSARLPMDSASRPRWMARRAC
ncbi:MAG: hypothetical protein V8Q88_02450 [Christensenellales bacterium]